jgi:uncharacterized protein (TIGR02147 family)
MSETRTQLREIATALPVTRYLSPRDYLKALYDAVKGAADAYSYLQFADDLGFSKTNVLRLVIVGQRPLTSKAAEKIARGLDLHGESRRYWTALVKYANARLPAERERFFKLLLSHKAKAQPAELSATDAEYFGEWYHPVIREVTGLKGFDGDPEWIRARLTFPLRIEQIRRSLELLTTLGYVRFDPSTQRYVRARGRVSTDAEVDSLAIVRYHQKMIEIGRESITVVPVAQRDVRAVTVSLPAAAIPVLKGKIEEWVASVAALEEDLGGGDQVVQVNVQMFPFTKRGGA